MQITFTVFDEYNKPETGRLVTWPWQDFVAKFKHKKADSKAGVGLSPVRFADNYRDTAHAIERYAAFGDHEQRVKHDQHGEVLWVGPHPPTPAAAAEKLREKGVAGKVVTTWKHAADAPRYRTIIPYKEPLVYPADQDERAKVIAAEAEGLMLFYAAAGLGDGLDTTKIRPDAFYYAPRCPDLNVAEEVAVDGEPLDFAPWLELGKQAIERKIEEQAKAAATAAALAEERRQRDRANGHAGSLLEDVRASLPTFEKALADAGYRYFAGMKRWLYPSSSSGLPGVVILNGQDGVQRYVSHHDSDPLGIHCETFGAKAHDMVDFAIYQKYGLVNDFGAALLRLAAELGVIDRRKAEEKMAQQDNWGEGHAEDFDEVRRERQREENQRIGDGDEVTGDVDILTLEEAEKRFVFITEGSRVADLQRPRLDIALADFRNMVAASEVAVEKTVEDRKTGEEKTVIGFQPLATAWRMSPKRLTVVTRTFRPSAPLFCRDPAGVDAFNSWRPRERVAEVQAALADRFFEHVAFIFGDEADAFLDWLAHIEQKPGVLPHTAWLNVATQTGVGRNWLASVLVRLWRGEVAANVDLPALLEGGFNGRLSGKVLAIVDEIREGGGGEGGWRFTERLKSIVTEEIRLINPKFGRQSVEFNCCRWLLFSNHRSALRLTESDRRFNVSICDSRPRSEAYYAELYGTLDKPGFIDAVATALAARDLSRFNPGARAIANTARAEVVGTSKTEVQQAVEMVRDYWPADVIPNTTLADIIAGDGNGSKFTLQQGTARHAIEDAGMHPYGKTVKVEGKVVRFTIIRNVAKWKAANGMELALELKGKVPDKPTSWSGGWKEYLENLAAEPGDPTV